jgi:alpha-beta hydrolase superfamily lysophospholipase
MNPSSLFSTTVNGLAVRDWPVATGTSSRGTVLIVHGLGEHMGRYNALAKEISAWGFAVRGYDHYGHGKSGGPRGSLTHDTQLLDGLGEVIDDTRTKLAQHPTNNQRLILLGHSLGGLVASRFVALKMRPVDGLVLSSPALDAGMNAVQKMLVAVLPRLLPDLRVGNGVQPQFISHESNVIMAYKNDPLVHDRIAARLARFIADAGPAVLAQAPSWETPTLLMYAGEDKLLNPYGSRRFAAVAPRGTVESHCYETLYHELFNESEPGRSQVLDRLKQWLNQRF